MRVRLVVDSATPDEVRALTVAFQRGVDKEAMPAQIGTDPTVTVCGRGMGWATPALAWSQVGGLMDAYEEYALTVEYDSPLGLTGPDPRSTIYIRPSLPRLMV